MMKIYYRGEHTQNPSLRNDGKGEAFFAKFVRDAEVCKWNPHECKNHYVATS